MSVTRPRLKQASLAGFVTHLPLQRVNSEWDQLPLQHAASAGDLLQESAMRHDFGQISVRSTPTSRIQAKLTVSHPDDEYEQEADQVADHVMRMPEPTVQRACACGGSCPSCSGAQLQLKHVPGQATTEIPVPDTVNQSVTSLGQPLDRSTRDFMESRFGHDFGHVRIHTGTQAEESARAIEARAYTLGHDIVFGSGQYNPGMADGRRLLAHELVHTLQQRPSGNPVVHRDTQNPLMRLFNGALPDALSSATAAVGLILGRSLEEAEKKILEPVFGTHLDYSAIKICSSSLCSPDGTPRTLGNLITTGPKGISNSTLIHEAAHVWQHQNGVKWEYITSALGAQFASYLLTGSRNGAYDWKTYYDNKVPWAIWNAEAQAEYIETKKALPPAKVWATGGALPVP